MFFERNIISVHIASSPWSLGIQMVDVVRYCVVIKNRRVFLLEVWSDCLDQHRTCENRNQKTIYYQISAPDHWNEKWQLLLTSPHFPILCRAGFNQKIFRKRTQYLCFSVRLTFQKLFQKQMKRKRLTGKKKQTFNMFVFFSHVKTIKAMTRQSRRDPKLHLFCVRMQKCLQECIFNAQNIWKQSDNTTGMKW